MKKMSKILLLSAMLVAGSLAVAAPAQADYYRDGHGDHYQHGRDFHHDHADYRHDRHDRHDYRDAHYYDHHRYYHPGYERRVYNGVPVYPMQPVAVMPMYSQPGTSVNYATPLPNGGSLSASVNLP